MRSALFLVLFLASCAASQHQAALHQAKDYRPDAFVRASDECGASRYAHLVGEQYAKVEHVALPSSAVVHRLHETLEYRPGQLNVVLGGDGRIMSIGCY